MIHHKNNYHPLFIVLFVLDLLPHEAVQQIPRTTRNEWKNKNLQKTFGFSFCALYIKYFDDVVFAHKYTFSRYAFSIIIDIQKTFLSITQNALLYKKLLRTQAHNIVEHITTIALKGFSVKQACKLFGIKKSWYQYHKRKINCPLNAIRICFKQHPNQLSFNEQQSIKHWIHKEDNQYKNLTQLYYEALNNKIIFCSKNTFNFYARLFGYKKAFRKPKAKSKKGYRASQLFEALHIDTTYVPTLFDGVLKLTMVKDNFSKAPLHFDITQHNISSPFIKQVLEQTFDRYKLYDRTNDINIISDGGAENKGDVLTWMGNIKAPPCVNKITAKSEVFPHANNMIEGTFNLFKHDFLKGQTITDLKHLTQKANEFITHCHNRYFGELYGITPIQILNGAVPDKDLFKTQIQQAAITRRQENKNFNNCTMPNCE